MALRLQMTTSSPQRLSSGSGWPTPKPGTLPHRPSELSPACSDDRLHVRESGSRIGHFQHTTMRLLAERLLSETMRGQTYARNEVTSVPVGKLSSLPTHFTHHVYCSKHNEGALALLEEFADGLGLALQHHASTHERSRVEQQVVGRRADVSGKGGSSTALLVTDSMQKCSSCAHFLLYLTGRTWTSGDASEVCEGFADHQKQSP